MPEVELAATVQVRERITAVNGTNIYDSGNQGSLLLTDQGVDDTTTYVEAIHAYGPVQNENRQLIATVSWTNQAINRLRFSVRLRTLNFAPDLSANGPNSALSAVTQILAGGIDAYIEYGPGSRRRITEVGFSQDYRLSGASVNFFTTFGDTPGGLVKADCYGGAWLHFDVTHCETDIPNVLAPLANYPCATITVNLAANGQLLYAGDFLPAISDVRAFIFRPDPPVPVPDAGCQGHTKRITWAAVTGADSYQLLLDGEAVATIDADAPREYTLADLRLGRTYTVTMTATAANGQVSDLSAPVSFVPCCPCGWGVKGGACTSSWKPGKAAAGVWTKKATC